MFENVLDIAKYIIYLWYKEKGGLISEVRLNKYLYFIQREFLIYYDKPLFLDVISGRKYGPVVDIVYSKFFELCEEIRNTKEYKCNLGKEAKRVVDEVLKDYEEHSDLTLIRLTKGEYSWKISRMGVSEYEDSYKVINLEDIKEDAKRVKYRRAFLNAMLKDEDNKVSNETQGTLSKELGKIEENKEKVALDLEDKNEDRECIYALLDELFDINLTMDDEDKARMVSKIDDKVIMDWMHNRLTTIANNMTTHELRENIFSIGNHINQLRRYIKVLP